MDLYPRLGFMFDEAFHVSPQLFQDSVITWKKTLHHIKLHQTRLFAGSKDSTSPRFWAVARLISTWKTLGAS